MLRALLIAGVLLGGVSVLVQSTTSAAASTTTYRTTLRLTAPIGTERIDRIVWVWTTSKTEGTVDHTELSDWSMEIWSGTGRVYRDVIMVDGVLQDVGGNPRVPDDTFWEFDLHRMELVQFRNFQYNASGAGVHYLVADNVTLPLDGEVFIDSYADGQFLDSVGGALRQQYTAVVTRTVGLTGDACKAGDWQLWGRAEGTSLSIPSDCTPTGGVSLPSITFAGGILYGSPPPGTGGFGTFVFGGGTFGQLLDASGCPESSAAFFYNGGDGGWGVWIPGVAIEAVNDAMFALFPTTIPRGTIFTARCV